MADLSKLILTDNTTVILKDNSQVNSDHRHYGKDMVPLVHKVYESTSYYGTANDWENTSWYFMSVKPDDWYKPWRVKFKVHSFCPNSAGYQSYTWATLCGRETGTIYANWNERYNSAHSYITVYPLKKAGFDAGYGHAVGVSIYNADNRTSSTYYRTFEIDYYECENCTVTILDTPVKWSSWTGTGGTNYNAIVANNAIDRGLQETGDANSSAYIERPYYTNVTAGGNGIKMYSLFARLPNGTYSSFTTGSGTGTKTFDTTTAFDFSEIYYANRSSDLASGSKCGNDQFCVSKQLTNMQYTCNGVSSTASASSLVAQKYLYLTVSHDWKLVSPYYTQEPTASTTVYYVLLGFMYDCYRLDLWEDNPIYEYDGTSFKLISNADAQTVNGHTVATNVPSGAVFTDTKVTSTANHYTPATATGSDLTASASGGTAAWSIDVVQGVTLNTDSKGHVTGLSVTSGKIPANPNSDTKVRQTLSTTNKNYPLLLSYGESTDTTANIDNISYRANAIYANPSTGNIQATKLNGVDIGSSPKFTDTNKYHKTGSWSGLTYTATAVNSAEALAFTIPTGSTATTVSAGNHTHTTSLATDTGTSTVSLSANTKYKLTAGGTSVIFTTPVDNNTTYGIGNSGESVTLTAGGTGTSVSLSTLINGLSTGSSTPVDADYYVSQYVNGGTTTTSYHRRPMSALWTYVKGKIGISSGDTFLKKDGTWATPTDTKNTAGSTDTSSKIYLIGATSQAANPQTYSDDQVHVTNGALQAQSVIAPNVLCCSQTSGTSGGISLYSGISQVDTYGIAFRTTANSGKHGYVSNDWATYFNMSNSANRGWVFRRNGVGGVASIDTDGKAVFNGSVTIGGNSANTSGARMEFNSTTQAIDFVFV